MHAVFFYIMPQKVICIFARSVGWKCIHPHEQMRSLCFWLGADGDY